MKKKFLFILIIMLLCISCFLIPSIVNYSVIKKECTDIVSTALNCSYNSFGDYSQLPEKYKNSVSKYYFDRMYYRDNFSDSGELGKDYYEVNKISPFIVNIKDNDITVTYQYTYIRYSYKDNENLAGAIAPVTITMQKKDGIYIITDFYEAPW